MNDLRQRMAEELSHEPPMGDLANRALRAGRQARRIRTAAGMAAAAVAVLTVVAGVALTGARPPADPRPAATASPAPADTAPSVASLAAATPEGLLELLSRLLPPDVRISDPRRHATDPLHVRVTAERGGTKEHLEVAIGRHDLKPVCDPGPDCRTKGIAVIGPDTVPDRPGWRLYQAIKTDGQSISGWLSMNAGGTLPLSHDELSRLLMDPRWGTTLPREILDAGQRNFRDLQVMQ